MVAFWSYLVLWTVGRFGGVAALGVAETLDEVEHRQPGLDLVLELDPIEKLALESGEDALAPSPVRRPATRDTLTKP